MKGSFVFLCQLANQITRKVICKMKNTKIKIKKERRNFATEILDKSFISKIHRDELDLYSLFNKLSQNTTLIKKRQRCTHLAMCQVLLKSIPLWRRYYFQKKKKKKRRYYFHSNWIANWRGKLPTQCK